MRWPNVILLAIMVAAAGSAAQSQTKQPASSHSMSFQLTSSAFSSGGAIPRQYTCDGADHSPDLHWSEPPRGAVTFALVMHDPDAPVGDWVHWVVWNLPQAEHGMAANFPKQAELPNGTRQGSNDSKKTGYNGPCPPTGKPHRYVFRVYAVDTKLDLAAGATRADLESALKEHILAEAEYMGMYHR